jgi:uncharacterized protein (DUF1810 family)
VTNDPHDLQRFVDAQRTTYDRALRELTDGRKRSHWMWYVFPQIEGLGASAMARRFAIASLQEAEAYLRHPILGPRLAACAEAVLAVEGHTALEILGTPDDVKLRSSATLFAQISPPRSVFHRLLDRYFGGEPDEATLRILAKLSGASSARTDR